MKPVPDEPFATTEPKPRIPADFYARSLTGAAGLFCFMLTLFGLPALINYHLLFNSDWPLALRLLLSLPLFLVAGQGVHLMGWIGHDGFHFTFHRNRYMSVALALLGSSMTVVFFNSGMAIDHWSHHRFANTGRDPDLGLLRHYGGFWSRLLRQRNRANLHYFLRAWRLALGRPLPAQIAHVRLPFALPVFRWIARANFALALMWLAIYLSIEARYPGFIWIGVLIPLIIGGWLSGLRSFTEHADTEVGDLRNTRSRTHWLLTIMEFGGNYHLEHHLYPSVPQWRLPRLHRWLCEQGYYDRLPDPGILDPALSVYRYTLGRYEYGRKTSAPVTRTGASTDLTLGASA